MLSNVEKGNTDVTRLTPVATLTVH